MNELLQKTIDAHGGLSQWKNLNTIAARLKVGGVTWAMKGHPNIMDDIHVTVDLKKQWASHYPFFQQDWHTSFGAGYKYGFPKKLLPTALNRFFILAKTD